MIKNLIFSILFLCASQLVIANGPWIQKTSFPAEGRHRTTGFSVGNKGYIGLGHYNSGPQGNVAKADIWEFDPSNDSWTQKADFPTPTYGATAFTIGNLAYVGGHVYGGSEFYEFDPIANTWTAVVNCLGSGSDVTSFSIGDKGYFLTTTAFYEFDPSTEVWTQKTYPPTSVSYWTTSFSIQEKGYYLSANGGLYEYKPLTDQWAVRAIFPGNTVGGWSSFVINDEAYICTGYVQFLSPTSREMWKFNPELNEWFMLEEFPGSTRRFSSAFSIGNKGYLGTGTNGTNFNDFWEYNPELTEVSSNSISNITVYPNPSTDHITLQLSEDFQDKAVLLLYNSIGQVVKKEPFYSNSVTLHKSNLNTGSFIYLIKSNNTVIDKGQLIFE